MRKKCLAYLTAICACFTAVGFAACGGNENNLSTSRQSASISMEEISSEESSSEEESNSVNNHTHSYGDWKRGETTHWQECECGAKRKEGEHTFGEWITTQGAHWKECYCGERVDEGVHSYTEMAFDDDMHWEECICGVKTRETAHSYVDGVCSCGKEEETVEDSSSEEESSEEISSEVPDSSSEEESSSEEISSSEEEISSSEMEESSSIEQSENSSEEEESSEEISSSEESSPSEEETSSEDSESADSSSEEVHTHEYLTEVIVPTCTAQGYTVYTCECGVTYNDNYTDMLGHTESEWIVDKAATCTETGSQYKECTVCYETLETENLSALGHTASNWIIDVDPTCTEAGGQYKECAICGEILETEEIPAAGHHYGDDNICDDCGDVYARYTRVDKDGNESATGNYILFGSYPQSKVTDSTLINTLNTQAGTLPVHGSNYGWTSYGYYQGTGYRGSESNATDYMWYQDERYNGETYRGVYFTSYRPYYTNSSSSIGYNSYQYDNGYTTGTTYWFQYEPIKWKIMTEENGYATLLCEMIIDSQDYNYTYNSQTVNGSTVYANNYEYSTIRAWLNDNFYNTAFNELQKALIQTVTVDNSVASTGYSSNQYACNNTQDKVWLLSAQEAIAMTGSTSSSTAREKKNTDYAQCQGAWTSTSSNYAGNGEWRLRSPYYDDSIRARVGGRYGDVYSDYIVSSNVNSTYFGVVPALKIRLS